MALLVAHTILLEISCTCSNSIDFQWNKGDFDKSHWITNGTPIENTLIPLLFQRNFLRGSCLILTVNGNLFCAIY